MPTEFLLQCASLRDAGYRFLGLQTHVAQVSYLFEGHGEVKTLRQELEDGTVSSVAMFFPLADFAEREMYRDRRIKALGNSNLMPREELPI